MKKRNTVLITMMLGILVLAMNVSAIDTIEPQIQDEENDVMGPLVEYPVLFQILQKMGIVPIQSFEFMDVTSAWFYEDLNEPNYLFITIKIKDLAFTRMRAIYAVHWTFNEKHYGVACHTHSDGAFTWFAAGQIFGLLDNWAYKKGLIQDISDCTINTENNHIVLKIPKTLIGDPNPGDVLTETSAWTGLRFISEIFTYFFGGELAKDPTPYGSEYIIQY